MKPNLRAFHEQCADQRRILSMSKPADESTAAHIRNLLSKPDPIVELAEADAARGDWEGLLVKLDNTYELCFVCDNVPWLKSIGAYEPALLCAWAATRINNRHWSMEVLRLMFKAADRNALLSAGHPLPHEGPFCVFRGVGGSGAASRRVRGFAWTLSTEKAVWFAKRAEGFGLSDPTVYRTTIPHSRVLAYLNDRQEEEILCDVEGFKIVDDPLRPVDAPGVITRVWPSGS
jgi:hypothetical protein